ncbi:unnamed protein product [Ambrosiozyma monospora]|uniref:Unnamed protein product n=2 Tax=Ambrosiozyma monospora TaxID=43982 RepID=A0ACB5TVX0_AMBMO|nr:unnamed protein product [Ambrosiozyma monospora]
MMTEGPHPDSTFYDLYAEWERLVSQDNRLSDGSLAILDQNFTLTIPTEIALHGTDLNSYLKKVEERRAHQKEIELEQKKNDDLLNDDIFEEDDAEDDVEPGVLKLEGDNEDAAEGKTTTSTSIMQSTRHNDVKDEDENVPINSILKMPMDFDVRNAKGKNRMFPFIVKKVAVDDYGIVINHNDFMREEERFILKATEADGDRAEESADDGDESDNQEADYNEKSGNKRKRRGKRGGRKKRRKGGYKGSENSNVLERKRLATLYNMDPTVDPVSIKKTTTIFSAKCGITFVDMSGLADLKSMKITFNNLKPRKVILLPNTSYSSYIGDCNSIMQSMVKQQRDKLMGQSFFSQNVNGVLGTDYIKAQPNELIDLGSVITSYDLQLDDDLDKQLKWQEITGGYSIAHIVGEVSKNEDDVNNRTTTIFKLHNLSKDKLATLDVNASAKKLTIGDVKLNELRLQLSRQHHHAEFKGDGALVVDNQIVVRKITDGRLVVDGLVCRLFYEVRDLVNSMLAVV